VCVCVCVAVNAFEHQKCSKLAFHVKVLWERHLTEDEIKFLLSSILGLFMHQWHVLSLPANIFFLYVR
jgi:hypothetical protein